jgi:signal transduction histidine kinase
MEFDPLARLRRSVFALPLAAMAALVVVVINESSYRETAETIAALGERGVARVHLQTLLRSLADAESGQRGYLLTGRKDDLEPYEKGLASIEASLRGLHEFYVDDPKTHAQVTAIESKARERLSIIATSLSLYDSGQQQQWRDLLLSALGKEKMEALRDPVRDLIDAESARVVIERRSILDTLWRSRIGVNIMAAAALAALLLFLRKTRALDHLQFEHAQTLRAERDQLEAEVTRRTVDLTELAQHLEVAREDERGRLARELHDELGALLTAAKLDAARLKRGLLPMLPATEEGWQRLHSTLDQGIALKRNIIENLRPSSLSNLGLVAALEIQAREFAKRSEVRVRTELEPAALSDNAQITVYRLVQESLTNIAKYARASEVAVTLSNQAAQPGRVLISVRDNGVGFDATSITRAAHGLTGMRYRVEGLGGAMQITSAPGQGTTISAWLPTLSS